MKKYIAVAKILFKTQLVWRFDIVFNMLFTFTKILFAYILWGAVFGQKNIVAGFTFHSMLSYYTISSFLSQIEMSEGVSGEISSRIRGGTFSKYMVIPINVQGHFLAQTIGASSFFIIFNLLAAVVWVFIFHVKFTFTTNVVMILSAIILILLGLVFMVQLNFFLGILTFKFQDISLFLMIKNNLIAFITGTLIPLSILPDIIVAVMRVLPFYYVTYLPSMLLIGQNSGEAGIGILALSTWVLIFIPINKITYNRLRVRFDGVGI